MPRQASYPGGTARGLTMLVASLSALLGAPSGCNRQSSLPPLPSLPVAPKVAAPEKKAMAKTLDYRTESGTPIAPSVIADDPPPPVIQPASDKKPVPRATLNGDPNGISRETLDRAVQGAMGGLAACFSSMTGAPMVAVSFEADPGGHPSQVRVAGAPPDAERCVRALVQNIRYPSFEGKGVHVDLPLSFHQVQAQPQASHQQPQAPAAPSLFLDP